MINRLHLILLSVIVSTTSATADLQAGAARTSIVPPFPTHMGGFGDRMDFFTGARDDLYARALVIENESTSVIFIATDLMALDEALVEQARDAITEETAVPREHIMISCAHNHSAPSYYQFEDEADQQKARDFFAEQFAAAAIEAYETRRPAEIGYANGELRNATRNRQQDNDLVDEQVGVLRVEEKEGRAIIATLFNFTGHPVILGSDNLELSGEFPGWASRTVEQVLDGVALFTQGACGDITVQRSGDPWDEIQRLGRLIAGEVIATAESIRPSDTVTLAAGLREFPLEVKPLPDLPGAEKAVADEQAALDAAKSAGAPDEIIRHHENRLRMLNAFRDQRADLDAGKLERPDTYPGSVQVIQVGDTLFVGMPGEVFVEYALELRQRIRQDLDKNMCFIGYANGYVGYIVTPRATYTGGYEASVARVAPDSGRKLTEAAVNLAHSVVH